MTKQHTAPFLKIVGQRQYHMQVSGDTGGSLTVFIHGGKANLSWWQPIIPNLAPSRCYCLMSLYGHGYSQHLDEYTIELLFEPLYDLITCYGKDQPVTIVGHSMGGIVAHQFHLQYDKPIQLVLVDAPINWNKNNLKQKQPSRPLKPGKDLTEMLERFRILPDQPLVKDKIIEQVVAQSVRKTATGYIWSFDPDFYYKLNLQQTSTKSLKHSDIHFIYGTESKVINAQALQKIKLQYPHMTFHSIRDGHHAIMFDHPDELTALLNQIITCKG